MFFSIIGETKDAESPASTDSLVMDWTPSMDRYFIDIMIDQVSGEHKVDEAFNEQAWAYMVTSFNDKFGLHCDKYFLENRYMLFMKQYNDISDLLSYSGFAWNEAQQTVTAEDHVWEAYTKVHFFFDIVVFSLSPLPPLSICCEIQFLIIQLPHHLPKKQERRKEKKSNKKRKYLK